MARIYVGTFAKYAAGSLGGAWVDPDHFSDLGDFLAHCRALHSDEADPEFMFQDTEGLPPCLVSESSIDPRTWDFLALDDCEAERVAAFWSR
jgi:antirestriction protein